MLRWTGLSSGLFFLLLITGCVSPRRDGSTVTSGGGGGTTTQGRLYVSNDSGNAILRFDNAFGVTGNTAPGATIAGALTQLISPQYLFIDTQANRLFVANLGTSAVLIFDNASTQTGNAPPTRTIQGAASGLTQPTSLFLDKTKDLLYVVDGTDVLVFASASTINGDTPPVRVLTPNPTFSISAIFLDATNDRLYLADPTNAIDVFDGASTLNGTVTAPRKITGAVTGLTQPGGLWVDGSNRLIVSNFSPPSIEVFASASTATGDVTPSGVIAGSNTTLVGPGQIALNPNVGSGDLYVADPFAGEVAVFANIGTANGNIAPTRTIAGASTNLARTGGASARGVTIDTTR
jgi:hypothetical protein